MTANITCDAHNQHWLDGVQLQEQEPLALKLSDGTWLLGRYFVRRAHKSSAGDPAIGIDLAGGVATWLPLPEEAEVRRPASKVAPEA